MEMVSYDILVIGGGHAGLEAVMMAAQYPQLKVALMTIPGVPLASAPCNPAIGGVGKGQVVREIDALGGVMGLLADQSAIQYRTLNTSKGHAVQSTRVQIDKEEYVKNAQALIEGQSNITVIRERVDAIEQEGTGFFVLGQEGARIRSQKIILTTGTFLNGKLHSGKNQIAGGRTGCSPSKGLKDIFSGVKTVPVRFKTGTPPRLKVGSVDFSVMEEQKSDPTVRNFHWGHIPFQRFLPQVSCYLTKTNKRTLDIIRLNKDQSPIFNGQIQGVGPRYCPSIEDKAHRYPERETHHLFIEPEGLQLPTLYPNGISTSLPVEVQEEFIRTIPGLEQAEIVIPGYAVEYDVVDTTQLDACLEYRAIPGLYFAGQVNGTSGYEEAAGQGLVAGINAALKILGHPPLILSRYDSYIGVMVEDLISNLRDEPYRLFTARSENRLSIREDNVLNRMFIYRKGMKLRFPLDEFYDHYHEEFEILAELCEKFSYLNNEKNQQYFQTMGYGPMTSQKMTVSELLKQSTLDPVEILQGECRQHQMEFSPWVVPAVAISKKYEGYIHRATLQNEKMQKLDLMGLRWEDLYGSTNISHECKERIRQVRPSTFGQLRLIEGIRPATLSIVAGKLW